MDSVSAKCQARRPFFHPANQIPHIFPHDEVIEPSWALLNLAWGRGLKFPRSQPHPGGTPPILLMVPSVTPSTRFPSKAVLFLGGNDFPLIAGSGYLSLGNEKRSPETSSEASFLSRILLPTLLINCERKRLIQRKFI